MSKPVILTGLRANNDLHIGNYFGALLPIVDLAKAKAGEYQINLFVPDLHSFTTPIDHAQLQEQIMNNIQLFVAAGLPIDNPDVYLYRQSYIPAHSELTWILDCFTGMSEMNRMVQFKEKSHKLPDTVTDVFTYKQASVGLFNYPVLMAADILLYGAQYVPVGDDQTQHLEFTRDIAERINNRFGELFTVPKPVKEQHGFFNKDQGLRIKDLADPTKKMSKSEDSSKGVIFLGDAPGDAKKKIMGATTDSLGKIAYDPVNQPGLANLLDLYQLLGGDKDEYLGQEQYGSFKTAVADKMAAFLEDFQARFDAVDDHAIGTKLMVSEDAMTKVAKETLGRVQKAIGLR